MGGVRTPGGLGARLPLNPGMRNDVAKKYVAEKLGIPVADINDPIVMGELREDLKIFRISEGQGTVDGIAAKYNISKLLDMKINCVERFLKNTGMA